MSRTRVPFGSAVPESTVQRSTESDHPPHGRRPAHRDLPNETAAHTPSHQADGTTRLGLQLVDPFIESGDDCRGSPSHRSPRRGEHRVADGSKVAANEQRPLVASAQTWDHEHRVTVGGVRGHQHRCERHRQPELKARPRGFHGRQKPGVEPIRHVDQLGPHRARCYHRTWRCLVIGLAAPGHRTRRAWFSTVLSSAVQLVIQGPVPSDGSTTPSSSHISSPSSKRLLSLRSAASLLSHRVAR